MKNKIKKKESLGFIQLMTSQPLDVTKLKMMFLLQFRKNWANFPQKFLALSVDQVHLPLMTNKNYQK